MPDESWTAIQRDGAYTLSFDAWPDEQHSGYWWLRKWSSANPSECEEMRRPVRKDYVPVFLRAMGVNDSSEWHRNPKPLPHVLAALATLAAAKPQVYFIVADCFVKIGWTVDARKRLKELQTGCPFPMELRALLPGGVREETALHQRFKAYRIRRGNEWFRLEGDLAAYLESIA